MLRGDEAEAEDFSVRKDKKVKEKVVFHFGSIFFPSSFTIVFVVSRVKSS